MLPVLTIRQTTNSFDVEDILSAWYDESSIEIDDVPRFEFVIPNASGVEAYRNFIGKEVLYKRLGVSALPGIIEDVVPSQGNGISKHVAKGLHTGYALLQARKLTNFDFDEDGMPATTRDGVTINPHNRIIFRSPSGTLGVDGLPPAVDGVAFDLQAKACIGTRTIHQIDFVDNSYLIPSQIYATSNAVQVYRDGPQAQTRPALQRVRNGTNFKSGVTVHSVPLYGNDKNVTIGGLISTIEVLFIGKRDSGSNNITVQVCRNASAVPASRTYTSITLTYTANYLGSGLDAWSGSVDLSAGAESVKNVLGFNINVAGGTGTTDTTYVYYGKIIATTVSDSGISEGTIDAYDNPFTMSGAENWVEADFQGANALDALARLQKQTASDPAVNPNPNWDMWVDANLALNFKERRGVTIAKVYSFAEENLKVIEHRYFGTDVRYQTIAYGPGSGDAQTRIVSKQAFTSGGLYDADRDWTVNPSTALYGRRARIGDFVDANEPSVLNLLRKAYADHKLHRDPQESIQAELVTEAIPFFTVGDSIPIQNLPTRTNATPRVIKLRRLFSGSKREKMDCTFGQPTLGVMDRIRNGDDQTVATTIRSIPNDAQLGISGNGLYFDKDHYGIYPLPIQDGAMVKGVKLRVGILPWQATSRSAGAVGGTTVPSSSSTSMNLNRNHFHGTFVDLQHYHSATGAGNAGISNASTGATNEFFFMTVPSATGAFYTVYLIFRNGSGATKSVTVQVRKNSTSGDILGTLTMTSLANGSYQTTVFVVASGSGTGQLTSGDTVRFIVTSGQVDAPDGLGFEIDANDSHSHTTDISGHTHALSFGIFQFGSDADTTGNLAPLYGKDVSFAIDPTVAAGSGIPTGAEFSAAQFPALIGHSQTVPGTYEFDITGFLATEANGIIKSGEHRVFFVGLAGTNNARGLTVVSVTPIFDYKRS